MIKSPTLVNRHWTDMRLIVCEFPMTILLTKKFDLQGTFSGMSTAHNPMMEIWFQEEYPSQMCQAVKVKYEFQGRAKRAIKRRLQSSGHKDFI